MIDEILDEKIIDRVFYTAKIRKYLGSPVIKVLIGQRRVGKSYILKSIIQSLIKNGDYEQEDIFYINKELPNFDHIKTYEDIKNYFSLFNHTRKGKKIFVGIDEIQEIQGWEHFINGLLAEYHEKIEIFITGSNSSLLSGELATYISGRYIEFEIFSLSFDEFCIFKQEKRSKENFLEYLKYGGLPGIFRMRWEDETIFSYLKGVYNTIVLKDIVQHNKVKNTLFFEELYKYTLANIGQVFSAKSISNYLKSQKITISVDSVLNYLKYASEVFLLYKVYSVNPDTKKFFEIYNKFYVGDLGLRNALVGYDMRRDIGKLLENYVYLELKRHGYEVQIGRLGSGTEIDFIAIKQGITRYFQVCYLLGSTDTMNREYASLESISDNWEKYVVSFDDMNFGVSRGINHINIMDIGTVL